MSKLFSVVGVSKLRAQDPFKLRVANGSAKGRAKRLERCGHVEVSLFEVEPMTKEKALAWLQVEHPKLAANLKAKAVKAPKTAAVKAAVKEVAPEVKVVDAPLSPAAKLALKRLKDAARKREKRAAEKALRETLVACGKVA